MMIDDRPISAIKALKRTVIDNRPLSVLLAMTSV